MESRADRERQPAVVREVAESESHDAVDRPAVEAPVKRRGGDTGDGGLVCSRGDAQRRVLEVVDRLRHPEKQQSDAHARREEHGKPGRIRIFRFRVRPSQAHPSKRRYGDIEAEQQDEVGGDNEKPIQTRGKPYTGRPENFRRGFLENKSHENKGDDGNTGNHKHWRQIDFQTEQPAVLPDIRRRLLFSLFRHAVIFLPFPYSANSIAGDA